MKKKAPKSIAFEAIIKYLDESVPEIKHIDQNLGQLTGNSTRPSVSFPCVLIDFKNFGFSDMTTNQQLAVGDLVIHMGFAQITPSSNIVEAVYRECALEFYELEQKLHEALQGWSPGDEFGYLTRISGDSENILKGIRICEIRYRMEYEDNSTKPELRSIPKPPLEVSAENA